MTTTTTTHNWLVPLPMDEQTIVDHLTGNGWYEWFHTVDYRVIDGLPLLVLAGDDDGTGRKFRARATIDQVVTLVNDVIARKGDGWKSIVRAIRDDDFDMNDADIVLQHIAFGRLVFG